jgi:hypothetical protein
VFVSERPVVAIFYGVADSSAERQRGRFKPYKMRKWLWGNSTPEQTRPSSHLILFPWPESPELPFRIGLVKFDCLSRGAEAHFCLVPVAPATHPNPSSLVELDYLWCLFFDSTYPNSPDSCNQIIGPRLCKCLGQLRIREWKLVAGRNSRTSLRESIAEMGDHVIGNPFRFWLFLLFSTRARSGSS